MGQGLYAPVDRCRTVVNRGEVWWVDDPELGRRPYLVLTRQAAIPILHGYLAVPATRTTRGIRTEVGLGPEDGMPEQCVLSLDNMGVVHRDFFAERICTLGSDRLAEVCRALGVATGC